MFFRDVIGQSEVKSSLLGQFHEGRVPHALMFSGPPGCGKLPMALAFARYLLCESPGDDDACGHCRSCMMLGNRYEHPDLHFVFPVVKRGGGTVRCDDYLRQWDAFISRQPYFAYQSWLDEIKAGNSQPMIYANESDEILRKHLAVWKTVSLKDVQPCDVVLYRHHGVETHCALVVDSKHVLNVEERHPVHMAPLTLPGYAIAGVYRHE